MKDKNDNPLSCRDAERSFLGCVVTSEGNVLDMYKPDPEAFFEWSFRKVYTVILKLHTEGRKISQDVIANEMGGGVNEMGAENFWESTFYPSPSLASEFFRKMQDMYALRKAKRLAETINEEISPRIDVTEFCQRITTTAANLTTDAVCENQLGPACDLIERRLDAIERGEKTTGLRTPMKCWNETYGGICDGMLYAIASRPGMGKTALMEQLICHILIEETPVLVFEKDMSPMMLIERMACRLADVSVWALSKGLVTRDQIAEVRRMTGILRAVPMFVYNPNGLNAEMMASITRREARVNKIKAVFLDHVQVLEVGKDLREGLTKSSLVIRRTTTETNIPHVILAHINRNGAKGRPTPEDIKEFDQLYGDCDGMVLPWTEADKSKLKAKEYLPMNFYFCKNRFGPVVEEQVFFDGRIMAFKNEQQPNL